MKFLPNMSLLYISTLNNSFEVIVMGEQIRLPGLYNYLIWRFVAFSYKNSWKMICFLRPSITIENLKCKTRLGIQAHDKNIFNRVYKYMETCLCFVVQKKSYIFNIFLHKN